MNLSRREFFVAGLGMMAAGCSTQSILSTARPGPAWPVLPYRPRATDPRNQEPPARSGIRPAPSWTKAAAKLPRIAHRSQWTRAKPTQRLLNRMGPIKRITAHHEGSKPVYFSDQAATIQRLEAIRRYHAQERHWGDIGYHYVVDRAGFVWAARDVRYQGAHVKGHNENNLGIMVLGNFNEQAPSSEQYATLESLLLILMHRYNVPGQRVHTHRELTPGRTECPGRTLQQHMIRLRRSGRLS